MKRNPTIAFIGDLTVDRYVNRGDIKLGGAALNMAIWTKRLGAAPSVVTAVGNDESGNKFLEKLKTDSIDVSHVHILDGHTSNIDIFVNSSGERRYGVWDPGSLAQYHLSSSDIRFLKKQDAVSVTIYPQFVHVLDELRQVTKSRRKKPLVSINYGDLGEFEEKKSVVMEYIDVADILVFGLDKDTDEQRINELQLLAAEEKKIIIVTLAKFGSIAYVEDDVFVQMADEVPVVDTTGAGDAFLAAFLVTFLQSKNIQQALQDGTNLASKVVGRLGAY